MRTGLPHSEFGPATHPLTLNSTEAQFERSQDFWTATFSRQSKAWPQSLRHMCFLTSIALCASESFKLQGERSVSASPNDNATAQGLASVSISSPFVQHHLEWKSSDNSMDPGGTPGQSCYGIIWSSIHTMSAAKCFSLSASSAQIYPLFGVRH